MKVTAHQYNEMTSFERGWADAEVGRRLKECPYFNGTGAAIAWRQGWKAFFNSFKNY